MVSQSETAKNFRLGAASPLADKRRNALYFGNTRNVLPRGCKEKRLCLVVNLLDQAGDGGPFGPISDVLPDHLAPVQGGERDGW